MQDNKNTENGAKKRSIFDTGYISGFRSVSKLFKGKLTTFLTDIGDSVVSTSSNTLSIAFLSYGLISLFIHILKYSLDYLTELSIPITVSSALMCIIGVLLLFSKNPLYLALQNSPITEPPFKISISTRLLSSEFASSA